MLEFRVLRSLVALIAAAVMLAGTALAQSTVTVHPLRVVVNPTPSFSVEVRVDRDASGSGTPIYFAGDPIRMTVRTTEDAYVYLFNVASDGMVYQIFPNRYSGSMNRVRVGETLRLPGAGYNFSVAEPFGVDKLIAVASRRQLDTSTLASFSSEFPRDTPPNVGCRVDCFASSNLGQDGLAQTLRVVVTPEPQADWVTDTVQFQIRRR
jgi:hypothetical protein